MSVISIDIDSSKNEIYLFGDINDLKKNRFAWRYVKDYLKPIVESDKIIIPIIDEDVMNVLSKIRNMLIKYGFEENKSVESEKILSEFYEEEQNFEAFSEMALSIRNNDCDLEDFKNFTESVSNQMITRTLYPLQLLSAYHLAFSQNACNFSVPGAGKTSVVYGAYAYLKSLPLKESKMVDKLLIVGPLSSFGPWELEYFECFGKIPSIKRLTGGMSHPDKTNYLYSNKTAELTLISYASVVSMKEDIGYFLRSNKVMMVLDEAHKVKNTSGGITAQSVLELAKYAKSRVILTGTPAPNGYEDLYNMFKFIWPSKNVIGFQVNQLRDISETNNYNRIDRLISNISPYFIRIKKSDLNIPPATINPAVIVDMGPVQRRIYDYIENEYISAMIEEGTISSRFKKMLSQARMIRLMQAASDPTMLKKPLREFMEEEDYSVDISNSINDSSILNSIIEYEKKETPAKYKAVLNIIEGIIADGGKVVVWATFIHTIMGLKIFLEKNGIMSQQLYGAIPVEQDVTEEESESEVLTREKIIRDFHSPDCSYKVIIANPFAVAESISLHKVCHNAIYIERTFNAAHFVQSKDRIHRYGLKPGVETNYYYVICKDSIDETIHSRLLEKEIRMTEIMESMPIPLFDNISEGLGDEDIKALIKDYVRRTKKT